MKKEIPQINLRVKQLIERYSEGNVANFANKIEVGHQRLNRCFNIDARNGKYPEPTKEILAAILAKFPEINSDWLFNGTSTMFKNEAAEPTAEYSVKKSNKESEDIKQLKRLLSATEEVIAMQKQLLVMKEENYNRLEHITSGILNRLSKYEDVDDVKQLLSPPFHAEAEAIAG